VGLDGIADAWFNRGLLALSQGEPGLALEWLSACCAARPTDAVARKAQARVWAQLGHWDEALNALERAESLEPGDPDLALVRGAIEAGRQRVEQKRRRKSASSPDA
jgi:tetratricopeptide (TPR) repeat protein